MCIECKDAGCIPSKVQRGALMAQLSIPCVWNARMRDASHYDTLDDGFLGHDHPQFDKTELEYEEMVGE